MQGLLADVNVQGHLANVRILLQKGGLMPLLSERGLRLVTFPELDLHPGLDDRSLWNFCQEQGWVLFTENRNHDGPDSLYGTLADSWKDGCLPVLTLANKRRFEHEGDYAAFVANEVGEIVFDVANGLCRDQPRIYVPRVAFP